MSDLPEALGEAIYDACDSAVHFEMGYTGKRRYKKAHRKTWDRAIDYLDNYSQMRINAACAYKDERYFCVCGEPVYAGEISCLKCGTPRPAYTRRPSKSEGGSDD